MSDENVNGNGEVKKLVELRHGFKAEVVQLEADLKTKFEQELDASTKDLKEKYLEKVVDWFYSNEFKGNGQPSTPAESVVESDSPAIEVTQTPAPTVSVTVTPPAEAGATAGDLKPTGSGAPVLYCDECGNRVSPADLYCSQCAAPLGKPKTSATVSMRALANDREGKIRIAREVADAPRPHVASGLQTDDGHREWARTRRSNTTR